MAGDDVAATGEDPILKELPSYTDFYSNFSTSKDNCMDEPEVENMRKSLGTFAQIKDDISRIRSAWCYLWRMKKKDEEATRWCDALYFWIGEIISMKSDGTKFYQALSACRNVMMSSEGGTKCSPMDPIEDNKLFMAWKNMFDYKEDRDFMGEKLEDGRKPCPRGYQEYVQRIQKACSTVQNKCTTKQKDHWCNEYEKLCKNYEQKEKWEMKCTLTGAPEGAVEEEDALGKLPSSVAYDNFTNNWSTYCKDEYVSSIKSSLRTTLQQYANTDKCLNRTLGVWFYVTVIMNDNSPSNKERCDYFYYWLGDRISKNIKSDSSFPQVMNAIYNVLEQSPGTNTCPKVTTATTISRHLFKQRKIVFDYCEDYSTLRAMLLNSGSPPNSKYKEHIQEVISAFHGVNTDCMSQSAEDSYCTQFRKIFIEHGGAKLSELQCLAEGKTECEAPVAHDPQASPLKSTNAPSHSAINNIFYASLTTGSLLITFFFYKYISLLVPPRRKSSIGSSTNNRRSERRGRSTVYNRSIRTEDSTLDDSTISSTLDDSIEASTVESAYNSTVGSTTADEFTTTEQLIRGSTVYTLPSSRGTNNKQRPQRQRGQRTNISYLPT